VISGKVVGVTPRDASAVGAIGGSREAVARAHLIAQWSADIVLFAHGSLLTAEQREQLAARAIEVIEELVVRLVVEDVASAVTHASRGLPV
jgi:thioredoxin reductase